MSGAVGLYVAGDSVIHRTRPGVKLLALAVGLLAVTLLRSPAAVVAGIVGVTLVTLASGIRPTALVRQLRPVLWFALAIGVVQGWLAGPLQAAVVVGTLLVAVAAAALVTLTTRTQEILDAVVTALSPLRRVGVDPERVALVLALAIRSIPVLGELAGEVQDARRARGAERSVRAFAVPLTIRTLRHADRLGEALKARGVDD